MARFVDHKKLGPEIRNVLQGDCVRCAVAFWGDGAAASLFVGPPPAGARIICDIAMGGTNPRELKELGARRNPGLKHLPGLHAKVYLSGSGLVVGSANASNNGIGFLDAAVLTEAGTYHHPDETAWEQASTWFDRLWKCAKPVEDAALETAAAAWGRRSAAGCVSCGRPTRRRSSTSSRRSRSDFAESASSSPPAVRPWSSGTKPPKR